MLSRWSWCLAVGCLHLVSVSRGDPEPARIPKVYNALITSSQNLAGSKSYPVYQPFYQETFGFPFPPAYYYQDHFKDFFGDSNVYPSRSDSLPPLNPSESQPGNPSLLPPNGSPDLLPPDDSQRRVGEGDPKTSPTAASDPAVKPPNESTNRAPPPQPSTEPPIPLNEFGLPPSLVPLNQVRPVVYDPFVRFPYYPHFDPYLDPFPFQSYPPLPQVYRFGENAPQAPQLPPEPKTSDAPESTPVPSEDSAPSTVPPPPSDLDVINYSKKDPSIPDVPPPPVPRGGLKDDEPKTNN